MNHHTCSSCHQPIPNGQAVIRSINFEKVAYHRECARGRVAVPAPALPAQREPQDATVGVLA